MPGIIVTIVVIINTRWWWGELQLLQLPGLLPGGLVRDLVIEEPLLELCVPLSHPVTYHLAANPVITPRLGRIKRIMVLRLEMMMMLLIMILWRLFLHFLFFSLPELPASRICSFVLQ